MLNRIVGPMCILPDLETLPVLHFEFGRAAFAEVTISTAGLRVWFKLGRAPNLITSFGSFGLVIA